MKSVVMMLAFGACLTGTTAESQPLKKTDLLMTRGRPGESRPAGWIRDWARTAADGYTGHLDEVHEEFQRAWSADFRPRKDALGWLTKPVGSWSAEGGAYWFDGLIRLAWQLDDPALKALAAQRLEPFLSHMNPKSIGACWWLNRDNDEERSWLNREPGSFQLWVAGITERPLEAWYAVTGDTRALRAIEWAFDDPRIITESSIVKPSVLAAAIEAAWLTGGATGVCATAEAAIKSQIPYLTAPPDETGTGEGLLSAFTGTRHGVMTVESLFGAVRAYEATGRRDLLEAALAWFAFIDRWAMQPYGVMVSDELWGWAGADRSSETCTVVAEPWTRTELMMLLGEGRWGDQVERAFFNAAPRCVSRDFRNHVYLQTANRMNESCFACASDYKTFAGGKQVPTRYKPTHFPHCCTAALNRLIPNYVQSMWMKSADGGVTAALYGPSTFATEIPAGRFAVREKTDYPFEDTIRLTVTEAPTAELPLRLRIPGWCGDAAIEVNDEAVPVRADRGFATVRRVWKNGDRVVLRLPMKPRIDSLCDNNRGGARHWYVSYGPLLFAWCPASRDENTLAGEICEPILDERALEGVRVVHSAMPSRWDWPTAAPVRLTVHDAAARPLDLIPYGCAPLHVALFRSK